MMNKLSRYKILMLLIILILSCNSDKKQLTKHLNTINLRKIASITVDNWLIMHYNENKDYNYYSLHKKDNDTIMNLTFKYYLKEDKYSIEDYNKMYLNKKDSLYYIAQLNRDTLYFYRLDDLSSKEKEFIVGKYYYMYKFNQLSLEQANYFEAHRDSLIKVRGNDLPSLPEL